MTRSLRTKHRLVFLGLLWFLPCVFAFSLAFRKAPAISTGDDRSIAQVAADYGPIQWTDGTLRLSIKIFTDLRLGTNGELSIELRWPNFNKPDLLLYWVEGTNIVAEELPPDARLLGAARLDTPLLFPEELRGANGKLILFSLADSDVVGVSSSILFQRR